MAYLQFYMLYSNLELTSGITNNLEKFDFAGILSGTI